MHFYYLPRSRWSTLEKLWPPSYFWTYDLWQRDAFRLGSALHRRIKFDLAHMLTYVTFRSPGYLWRLGMPFVWGPVGALTETPWRFLPGLGLRGCLHFAARNVINVFHKLALPGPRKAFRRAAAVLAATEAMGREIRRFYGRASEVICEIGPPPLAATECSARRNGAPLRLSWSGLHMPGKALPLLLRALAALPAAVEWRLDILGKGSCTEKWRRLAERLGLAPRCLWHGWVSRQRAISLVHRSHAFVITSVHDLTSTVLIEALSQGVPVICPDHCGFADVVTGRCGVKIPLRTPGQFRSDLTSAIQDMYADESARQRLAKASLLRASQYSWEAKMARLNPIYARAAAGFREVHAYG
jgi:glycosyltransferase involved in cell wall biosynthesis